MAIPLKGEAKLGDHTLTVNFGFFCALEDEMKISTEDILKLMLEGMTFTQLRTIIRAGLEKHHPGVTTAETEEIIDSAGGFKGTYESLGAALKAYMGEEAEEKDENPPKAA